MLNAYAWTCHFDRRDGVFRRPGVEKSLFDLGIGFIPVRAEPPPQVLRHSSAHSAHDSHLAREKSAHASESESPQPREENPRHPGAYCWLRCESPALDTANRKETTESRSCECRRAPAPRLSSVP